MCHLLSTKHAVLNCLISHNFQVQFLRVKVYQGLSPSYSNMFQAGESTTTVNPQRKRDQFYIDLDIKAKGSVSEQSLPKDVQNEQCFAANLENLSPVDAPQHSRVSRVVENL